MHLIKLQFILGLLSTIYYIVQGSCQTTEFPLKKYWSFFSSFFHTLKFQCFFKVYCYAFFKNFFQILALLSQPYSHYLSGKDCMCIFIYTFVFFFVYISVNYSLHFYSHICISDFIRGTSVILTCYLILFQLFIQQSSRNI